jgi:hypothetical protein
MLPFICKRIPSKERNNEHMTKSSTTTTIAELVIGPPRIDRVNQSYSDIDYFPMKSGDFARTVNDEKLSSSHGKEIFLLLILFVSFSMKDLSSDCYCNASENFQVRHFTLNFDLFSFYYQAKSDGQYLQPTVIQSQIIDIPKAIIQHNSGIINPKRS